MNGELIMDNTCLSIKANLVKLEFNILFLFITFIAYKSFVPFYSTRYTSPKDPLPKDFLITKSLSPNVEVIDYLD